MNRLVIILSLLLALLSSCSEKRQGEAMPTSEGFDITGVWMLVERVLPNGMPYKLGGNTLSYKMYDADSACYNFSLRESEGRFFVGPHHIGCYALGDDTLYFENGHEMPLRIIDDSTIVTIWRGKYTETWHRVANIPESRKEEFRINCYQVLHNKEEFKPHEIEVFINNNDFIYVVKKHYDIAIALGFITLFIIVYSIVITHRKRRMEQKLAAVKKELEGRSTLVIDAIKQVESNFFESDYYQMIRPRLAAGENMSDEDWREMEQQINAVYTGFTRKLRSLYDFSDVEFQVCLLIKLGISNNGIAAVINRAPNSVSSIRGRLYKKVLGEDGGAKEWDDFILSL